MLFLIYRFIYFSFEQEQEQAIKKELSLMQQKLSSADVSQVNIYKSKIGTKMGNMSNSFPLTEQRLHLSCDMRFPTMWYVQLAKPQISLCICTV